MVVLSIFVTAMLIVLWWIIKCYLGNMAAVVIMFVVTVIILCTLNSIVNEPTQQELHTYNQGRKGVGYL
jgi:hypothetical protein